MQMSLRSQNSRCGDDYCFFNLMGSFSSCFLVAGTKDLLNYLWRPKFLLSSALVSWLKAIVSSADIMVCKFLSIALEDSFSVVQRDLFQPRVMVSLFSSSIEFYSIALSNCLIFSLVLFFLQKQQQPRYPTATEVIEIAATQISVLDHDWPLV